MYNSKLVLIGFGFAPAHMLLVYSSGSRGVSAVILVYLSSWIFRFVARRHDPDEKILRDFLTNPVGKAALLCSMMAIQWVALIWTSRWAIAATLALLSLLFFLWATARSLEALRSRVAKILLTSFTLAICLVIGEAALRLVALMRPQNDAGFTWGHTVTSNSLGYREREFESPKPPNTFRIMVLGDSLTWGAGLASEERYSNRLEELLKRHYPEKTVEVLNFGVSGGPTVRERDILNRHILKTDPDLIVVGFCINDPQPRSQNYAVELGKYEPVFAGIHGLGTLGFSRTSGFLRDGLNQSLRNVGLVPQWPESLDRTHDENSSEWSEFKKALQDMKTISDERGLPPPLFVPLLQENGDFANPDELLAYILKWCSQAARTASNLGFVVVNMEDEFKSQGNHERWVNPWDGHPSSECNEIYARHIALAIIEQKSQP